LPAVIHRWLFCAYLILAVDMNQIKHNSQKQLSLFPEPLLPDRSRLERCLYQSLNSIEGANKRWEQIRELQPTDRELKQAIGYEFGICGGSTYPHLHAHVGGENPRFWMDSVNSCKPPTLCGKALLDLVRKILDL
jgi:hypothetical protein